MQEDDEEVVEVPVEMLKKTTGQQNYQSAEDDATEQMGTSWPELCIIPRTLKLACASSEGATANYTKTLKSLFEKERKAGGKKGFLSPYRSNEETSGPITNMPAQA